MSRLTHPSVIEPSPEVHTSTLHQNIENFLTKLRSEKQEEQFLDQYIKSLEAKIIEANKTKPELNSELKRKYLNLERQVKSSLTALNLLQAENKELKGKVEDMRLEGGKYKRIIGGLQQDIKSSSNLARASSISKLRERTSFNENKGKIDKILSNSASEVNLYREKVSRLSTELFESKREEVESVRKHTEIMSELVNRPLTALDLAKVLNFQESHLKAKLKKFQDNLNEYIKKSNALAEGLSPIFTNFNFSDVSVFSQSFITSENQIKDLKIYLLDLSSQIDSMKFSNSLLSKSLSDKMNQLKKSKGIREEIRKELNKTKEKVDLTNKKTSEIKTCMKKVKKVLEGAIAGYKEKMDKLNLETIDSTQAISVLEKLQCLEEIIHQVIMLKAFLAKKSSSFGTLHSIELRAMNRNDSMQRLKEMIEDSEIKDEFNALDSKLATPGTFQATTRKLYENLISKRIIVSGRANGSISPVPAVRINK